MAEQSTIKVLVVDDSPFFRHRVVDALKQSPRFEVVGVADNGAAAVDLCVALKPDVVTMDVDMPVMDGISAVREIMRRRPTPVLMLSSLTERGAEATLRALEAGAVDFLPKQKMGGSSAAPESFAKRLARRLAAVGQAHLKAPAAPAPETAVGTPVTQMRRRRYRLVVVGASTGGPVALQEMLGALPADFPLPIVVAVHMPAGFTSTFAQRLDLCSALEVREAADGDAIRTGRVLIAPGGRQMLVEEDGGALVVRIVPGDQRQLYHPSVDVLLGSAARAAPGEVLGIVMTGMGSDGRHGAELLKRNGSSVWTQDAASCVVYGMPQVVRQAGLSDQDVRLDEMAGLLQRVAS